jgi:hypothetical protein
MTEMAAARSATAYSKTTLAAAPNQVPAAKKSGAKPTVARAATTADSRKITEMLREIQIDGEALSAQIERLRHRFL